jgi:hypothetical protein
MKSENIDSLYQKYPNLFTEKCEISCGDGWFTIIDNLCAEINFYLKKNTEITYTPKQIKEKFGGLRFYYSGGDDEISGMVSMAEAWAGNTCETCGAPGKSRSGGWIKTLCDHHEAERQQRMKQYENQISQ